MILEVIRKENEKQRREGRKEGRKETIIQMLKAGVKKEVISKATNMSEKEIDKLVQNI